MRRASLDFRLIALALSFLAGCSGNDAADLSAKLGCGAIDGLGPVTGRNSPAYILVGEVIQTNEASAAFAELACQLAARQAEDKPLWVGLPGYVGGVTAAEVAMRKRFDELIAKGAPIVLGSAVEGHTTGASRREDAEKRWANTIMANVKSAGADRALLLLPRTEGIAKTVLGPNQRYSDYTPMALFLPEGQMMNLEVGQAVGIGSPTIRIYLRLTGGYMGQILLDSLTPASRAEADQLPN